MHETLYFIPNTFLLPKGKNWNKNTFEIIVCRTEQCLLFILQPAGMHNLSEQEQLDMGFAGKSLGGARECSTF